MTDKLPESLRGLFMPRPAPRWLQSNDHNVNERKTARVDGIAQYLSHLQDTKETVPYEPTESWFERKLREKYDAADRHKTLMKTADKVYKPTEDSNAAGTDPFKTLVVARIPYSTNENELRSLFEKWGPIQKVYIPKNKSHLDEFSGKKRSRMAKKLNQGYAFITYESERDFRNAVEAANGMRIKDRTIVVDFERGRTEKTWKPRYLGGGRAEQHYTQKRLLPPRMTGYGFPPGGGAPMGPRGGFRGGRGGGRGDFRGGRGGGGPYGGRGGIGYQPSNSFGDAPSGPRGPRSNGFGGGGGGRKRYDEYAPSGSNAEPVSFRRHGGSDRPRDDANMSYEDNRGEDRRHRDRDRDRDRERDRDRGDRDGRDRDYDRDYRKRPRDAPDRSYGDYTRRPRAY